MAIFKCLQSGQTVEFTQQHDIESMKGHAGYIRIDELDESAENDEHQVIMRPPEAQKRPGRPRKTGHVGH
jgi:hypothetical protein